MRVAIPRQGERVAPCFEYCSTMAVFTIADSGAFWQVDFPLGSREPLDRIRLLKDQRVETVICGGVQAFYEDLLRARGIEVISWVSGPVEELLSLYLRKELKSGTELPWEGEPDFPSMNRMTEH